MKSGIIYTHTSPSSFVSKDIQVFEAAGTVKEFVFNPSKKILVPLTFISQFIFLLSSLLTSNLYICQFAGYHSFLPALFAKFTGKKCLIISGGTDCVSFPGIGYGNFNKYLLGMFTRWSYKLASHLSPKHETLLKHKYTYDSNEPELQGILAFIPSLQKPSTVIYNGYDAEKWKATGTKKPLSFITLCGGWQFSFQEQLKGIDLILEVAPRFPQCTFAIAGVPSWKKLNIKSENIVFIPPVNNHELAAIFSSYQYYMQLSMAEGFPNALCEAMLCECIPIVSDVFSMPEIVGDSGFILKERNVNELKFLLQKAINSPDLKSRAAEARNRIIRNYSIDKRKTELINLIKQLMQ